MILHHLQINQTPKIERLHQISIKQRLDRPLTKSTENSSEFFELQCNENALIK